jgi:hypothetical protein
MTNGKKDSTRNRSRIKMQSNHLYFNTKPFISNEFFYDYSKKKYNKNRIDIGVNFILPNKLKSSLYYKIILDRVDNNWSPVSSFVYKVAF